MVRLTSKQIVNPLQLSVSSMKRSPRAKLSLSPPLEINKLTAYFASTSSPKKRCVATLYVDDEKDRNETSSNGKKPKLDGTTAAITVDLANPNMDLAMALRRIESRDISSPSIRSVRAGDDGVFLVRHGATIGRSVNPNANCASVAIQSRHKKMNLGIYGSDSGVSRKQLLVQRISPLIKMKQLPGVTNQVYVVRYNPLLRTMESKGTYIRKGEDFVLKIGDVLVMDFGREMPQYAYRVVECYVPRQFNHVKKLSFEQLEGAPSPHPLTIDLVSVPSHSQTESPHISPEKGIKPDYHCSMVTTKLMPVSVGLGSNSDQNQLSTLSTIQSKAKPLISSYQARDTVPPPKLGHLDTEEKSRLKPLESLSGRIQGRNMKQEEPKINHFMTVGPSSSEGSMQKVALLDPSIQETERTSPTMNISERRALKSVITVPEGEDEVMPVHREEAPVKVIRKSCRMKADLHQTTDDKNEVNPVVVGEVVSSVRRERAPVNVVKKSCRTQAELHHNTIIKPELTPTVIGEVTLSGHREHDPVRATRQSCRIKAELHHNTNHKPEGKPAVVGEVTLSEHREQAAVRATRKSCRVKAELRQITDEKSDGVGNIEISTTTPPRPQTKAVSKVSECSEEYWDIAARRSSPSKSRDITAMKEMPSTVSNSLVRTLNSTDPGVGSDLLIQMALCHKSGMNSASGRQIRDLLCEGPTSEGTKFPDAHRLEVTLKYLDKLGACVAGESNISACCSLSEWAPLHGLMENVISLRYICDGDEASEASDAWDRVIDSLHLSKSGITFLNMLFIAELREEIHSDTPDIQKCREGPLATAIWSNINGVRNSVKAIVKIYVYSWFKYGHYVLGDFAGLKGKPYSPSTAAIARCQEEGKFMLREIGTFLSYALWLYVSCERVRVNSRELACIVKDAYESEAMQSTFVPAAFLATVGSVHTSYLKKQKLHMILGIDERIVPGLRFDLAKKFGVEKELNIMIQ